MFYDTCPIHGIVYDEKLFMQQNVSHVSTTFKWNSERGFLSAKSSISATDVHFSKLQITC